MSFSSVEVTSLSPQLSKRCVVTGPRSAFIRESALNDLGFNDLLSPRYYGLSMFWLTKGALVNPEVCSVFLFPWGERLVTTPMTCRSIILPWARKSNEKALKRAENEAKSWKHPGPGRVGVKVCKGAIPYPWYLVAKVSDCDHDRDLVGDWKWLKHSNYSSLVPTRVFLVFDDVAW